MKSREFWKRIAGGLAAASLLFSGCGSSGTKTKVAVALNATAVTVLVNGTVQFSALVTGTTDTNVTWALTYTTASNSTATACDAACGTLSDTTKSPTTYTAPAEVPNPARTITLTATANADKNATAKATITLDSGIRVSVTPSVATIGTGESFQFVATVVNDSTDPAKAGVTWSVKESNAGTIDATSGVYTAPATVPNPATATIIATSKADTSRTGTATVTLVTAATPTFNGISPTKAPLGGIFQDVYLTATNLRSTSTFLYNGIPLPSSQVTVFSSTTARVHLTDVQLSVAGSFQFAIQGATLPPTPIPNTITIAAVRPALVASRPDSLAQSSLPDFLTLDGGYFGPSTGPVVSGQFDGGTRTVTAANARQLTVALNSGDLLNSPGLYQVGVTNTSAAQPVAVTNFTIQPSPAAPVVITNFSLGAGASPSAIAIDKTRGIAFVAEKGLNKVQRLDYTGGNWMVSAATYPVGSGPAGLAVDDSRQIVITANSTDTAGESVSIVNYQTGTKLGTIDLRIATNAGGSPPSSLPAAVGLDPASGLGFVALATGNIGFVFNYDATKTVSSSNFQCIPGTGSLPYCAIGAVTLASGAAPQIAMEPRLRWAFVTPGGLGLMSVVDLQGQTPVMISSIARASNIVTVKTTTAHNLNQGNPGTVVISGVPAGKGNTNFDGSFAVASIVDASTFTYNQTAADDTPSAVGGQVNFSNPLLTFTVSRTVQGIDINPNTETAVLADPASSFNQIDFLSTLDQTTTGLTLQVSSGGVSGPETGGTGVGYQPFTNIAVSVNPLRNEISLLDPVKPQRLAVIPTGGTGSGAVAVDPASNIALVANSGSNDVSVISLGGSIHTPQILEVRVPPGPGRPFPQGTFTSSVAVPVQIFGVGFTGSPQVRLDGTVISGATVVSDREIDVAIPASFLSSPRRYALDVVNGNISNASDFSVVQSMDLSGVCASAAAPSGVAIDEEREVAVVANNGCNNVSLIDLTNGTVKQTIAVGTAPIGVAVNPRLGLAVVSNNGSGSASVVNLDLGTQTSVTVGSSPSGVAINPASGLAYVADTGSNTLSAIDLTATTLKAVSGSVDQRPLSVAVDPGHKIALVGALNLNTNPPTGQLDIVDISKTLPSFTGSRVSASLQLPTGIVFDPVSQDYFAVSALSNSFIVANAQSTSAASVRVGVNPASLAYNYQSSTLVTVNALSNTISVVDVYFDTAKGFFPSLRTRATIGLGSPLANPGTTNPQFAAAIHPRSNLAVITDATNNRVLLLPLPR